MLLVSPQKEVEVVALEAGFVVFAAAGFLDGVRLGATDGEVEGDGEADAGPDTTDGTGDGTKIATARSGDDPSGCADERRRASALTPASTTTTAAAEAMTATRRGAMRWVPADKAASLARAQRQATTLIHTP